MVVTQHFKCHRYISWIIESAHWLDKDIHDVNGLFNWTMSFRQDADFYLPYGRIVQVKEHPPPGPELDELIRKYGEDNKHLVGNRTATNAAWFVSNCNTPSQREILAREMSSYANFRLDVYGACSHHFHNESKSCKPEKPDHLNCQRMAEANYKFYLSFENSLCRQDSMSLIGNPIILLYIFHRDYVTEKFFKIAKYNVIPVVLNYVDMEALAPPHSHVNVLDYNSTNDLVEALVEIGQDDALFASYFWWKDYYEVHNEV